MFSRDLGWTQPYEPSVIQSARFALALHCIALHCITPLSLTGYAHYTTLLIRSLMLLCWCFQAASPPRLRILPTSKYPIQHKRNTTQHNKIPYHKNTPKNTTERLLPITKKNPSDKERPLTRPLARPGPFPSHPLKRAQ
jgi:hypothetical protein